MVQRIERLKQFVRGITVPVPAAIMLGAVLIGASIIVSRLIAPYEIASGGNTVWRLNSVTGDLCWSATAAPGNLQLRCE
jgi:hypothetical protein